MAGLSRARRCSLYEGLPGLIGGLATLTENARARTLRHRPAQTLTDHKPNHESWNRSAVPVQVVDALVGALRAAEKVLTSDQIVT